MHRRLNVHLLYNTKYPLSLGYKAEEAEAICNAQTTHATLQEISSLPAYLHCKRVILYAKQLSGTKGLALETLF